MKNQLKFLYLILAIINSNISLADNVLITGGNKGIGLALVKEYLAKGHKVYTTYRSTKSSKELLSLKHALLTTMNVDHTKEGSEKRVLKVIKDTPIDVIIHNDSIYSWKANKTPDLDTKEWLESFHINAIAPIKLTLALQDNLSKSQVKKVVAISSNRASNSLNIIDKYEGRYAYRTSKAALNSGMIALAQDLNKYNIEVLMLHPGKVTTGMTNFAGANPSESAKNIIAVIEKSTLKDSGRFINVEDGKDLPW
ncbi:MAG: SDR family NAD(P)-dependent oxidoreductase [Sphingobacteriia bacterium]|nr:SDR family NAD(P)-dependent oxidoreductase [Sphingobacteriia bacterium]